VNKRLELLEQMASREAPDAFSLYGLALEYAKAQRSEEALATFERLRSVHPDYLPMYLMAGQLLIDLDREPDAKPWLEQGIALATRQGNGKARGELEAALATCD
jgi:tetratricopeptide (TPR) repeat protein